MLPITETLFIQTLASPKLQARFIPLKLANKKSLLLDKKLVKTPSTQMLHWNLEIETARSSYSLIFWTQLDFQTRFSPKKLAGVLSSKSQFLVFYFCCSIPFKMLLFILWSGFCVTKIDGNGCWFYMPRKSSSCLFSSTSFTFPPRYQSIGFYLKQTVNSLNTWNLSFTSEFESWLIKCGKSSVSVELYR